MFQASSLRDRVVTNLHLGATPSANRVKVARANGQTASRPHTARRPRWAPPGGGSSPHPRPRELPGSGQTPCRGLLSLCSPSSPGHQCGVSPVNGTMLRSISPIPSLTVEAARPPNPARSVVGWGAVVCLSITDVSFPPRDRREVPGQRLCLQRGLETAPRGAPWGRAGQSGVCSEDSLRPRQGSSGEAWVFL